MTEQTHPIHPKVNEGDALRQIFQGTAVDTGTAFFRTLVQNLAGVMNVSGAWVTEFFPESDRLRALAFWLNNNWVDHFEYAVKATPCEPVIRERRMFHVPDRIVELYPGDNSLEALQAVSYIGMPLFNSRDEVAGHLAVLDSKPMPDISRQQTLLGIFAARAGAELRRLRAEEAVRAREMQLSRLLDGAMDAIIELDQEFRITTLNAAAETVLGLDRATCGQRTLEDLFTGPSVRVLLKWIRQIEASDQDDTAPHSVWVPEMLEARRGETIIHTEATLSFRDLDGRRFYTLICRDVNDRIQAERRIQALADEAARLRQELDQQASDELVGQSEPMRRVRREIAEVAATDATVLILGETGTGKELVARAIHAASHRRDRPLVKVNCAAVPPNLIESEFFGHEKGAFTGATQKRLGRFALADGGTIFLDEIGELPLELQGKLLRVLQEGEFEPVGSSHTQSCDVRIIAATNRDLHVAVEAGQFRQDLYYRLNVYPIPLPPLRERPEDVPLLASLFAQRIAARLGRRLDPLTPGTIDRLRLYNWPGNVRELENVIERAVITARDGSLNLDRALPDAASAAPPGASGAADPQSQVLTVQQLLNLERQNLIRALEQANWRVSGPAGAAALVGVPPSTFNSRMKALNIRRAVRKAAP